MTRARVLARVVARTGPDRAPRPAPSAGEALELGGAARAGRTAAGRQRAVDGCIQRDGAGPYAARPLDELAAGRIARMRARTRADDDLGGVRDRRKGRLCRGRGGGPPRRGTVARSGVKRTCADASAPVA